MFRLLAPAKINLTLEVVDKRDDGYHDVRTILQAIGLADVIDFEEADDVTLTVEPEGAAPAEDNLVLHALHALRVATGTVKGAAITLRKIIPEAAGLGGGSSDAATTLLGLRRLWELDDLSEDNLFEIAAKLGSDVPFFLHGGTALATGRGDQLTKLPRPADPLVVVVAPADTPKDTLKTARLYGMLKVQHFTDGSRTNAVVRMIENGNSVNGFLLNTFEFVAMRAHESYEWSCVLLGTTGVSQRLLAGSGPAMFALAHDQELADTVKERMAKAGYIAHVVTLLPSWGLDGVESLGGGG
jgi:4-diphosphocytidyl-2-C-methyl-D-erythritol kinase